MRDLSGFPVRTASSRVAFTYIHSENLRCKRTISIASNPLQYLVPILTSIGIICNIMEEFHRFIMEDATNPGQNELAP